MKPQDRIANEYDMARSALMRAIKFAVDALENIGSPHNNMSASYIGRALHKLKSAEGHLNRADAEKQKFVDKIRKINLIQ